MSRAPRCAVSVAARVLAALLTASALHPSLAAAQPQVQWRELGPPARSDGAMVWDSRRGRALLFGGDGAFGVPYASPWQFLRSPRPHWEPLATRRTGHHPAACVYDSVGRVPCLADAAGSDRFERAWQLRAGRHAALAQNAPGLSRPHASMRL
jgi:hypothetical protein